ncbi:hypothetical protein [Metaclostridioides mangenotii]|uniref:hypothetical protein n=1 Tax=Metaclostridioides mangenotii TaxID=1540 RepID=UPI0004866473|nr:hypothetical protein [Clostridioides mangenotii]
MANNLEKDCIEFTIELLKGYRELKLYLEELKRLKEKIKCDYTAKSITYDKEKESPTNKISKEVEEEVIKTLTKIEELEKEIEEEGSLITKIDIAIYNLSPIHRKIIEYKYIEGLSWDEIIDKTSYSERSLRYKRSEAVKSTAITLFGIKVFREEDPSLPHNTCLLYQPLATILKGRSNMVRKNQTSSTLQEDVHIQEFLDMIAPSVVKFNTDSHCGNTYRCVWYSVNILPETYRR